MTRRRRRKCRHCGLLYQPDPRNGFHQRYCALPACRAASKRASQARWRASPKGQDYFKGSANVQRVRAWRKAHPGFLRSRPKVISALQDLLTPQLQSAKALTPGLTEVALQDVLITQRLLLLGLISNLSGSVLQENIASTTRRLILLGRQIEDLKNASGTPGDGEKTSALPAAPAQNPGAVQLDRSAPGSG